MGAKAGAPGAMAGEGAAAPSRFDLEDLEEEAAAEDAAGLPRKLTISPSGST